MSDVILYSTGCPRCSVLKKKLQEKGVTYEENNSVEEMIALGIMQVPMLSVGGDMMDFANAIIWVNKQ